MSNPFQQSRTHKALVFMVFCAFVLFLWGGLTHSQQVIALSTATAIAATVGIWLDEFWESLGRFHRLALLGGAGLMALMWFAPEAAAATSSQSPRN